MAGQMQCIRALLPEELHHPPACFVFAQVAHQRRRDPLFVLGRRQDARSVGVERRQQPEPVAAESAARAPHWRAADERVAISNQEQAFLRSGRVIVDVRRIAGQERRGHKRVGPGRCQIQPVNLGGESFERGDPLDDGDRES